jgi:hypothetical protein
LARVGAVILPVAGTGLVAKSYVPALDLEPVIGALLTIGFPRFIDISSIRLWLRQLST